MAKRSPKEPMPNPEPVRNHAPPAVKRSYAAPEAKRSYAARGIAGLLAPVVRPAFKKRAPAAAQLMADWDVLAGQDLSLRASPVKFAGGTLTLACTGPAAMELQHLAPQIIARLNLSLGHNMVERLRFIQQAPAIIAPVIKTARRTPVPLPANLPEGPLGEALAKLYQGVSSKD